MKVEAKLPAYPTTACADNWSMDIRTTIATKMMQGLLSNPGGPVQRNDMNGWALTNCSHQDVAEFSVALADVLIEELNK